MKQKLIIALIALTLVFSPLAQPIVGPIAPPVPTAYATGILTFDFSNWFLKIWEDYLVPVLLQTLKKAILDQIVNQIITYIQGGGKPKFVTDWKGFLQDAGQEAAGNFAQNAGLGFLCSPFSLQVKLNLLPVQKFGQRAACTLNQIVGNIKNFYGNFRNGGWVALGTGWEPQNNYFGATLMAVQQQELEVAAAQAAKLNDALSSNGWLSVKDKNGNIVTPGQYVGDLIGETAGIDIKYVLSQQDLASYAGAIANALINRVMTEGLSAVQTSSNKQDVDAANAAVEASVVTGAFQPLKSNLLGAINATVGPRSQAQSLIDTTINNLNKYISDLANISQGLTATGKSICQSNIVVADVKKQISTETDWASTTIGSLLSESDTNKTILDPLEDYIAEINQLAPSRDSLSRLDQINSAATPILDSEAANAFYSSVQSETGTINQRISQNTATFNQQLQQCQKP